jgi:hypothetical protein
MSDYGPWSRLLHRLALGLPSVAEATFDIEQRSLGNALPVATNGNHVFVTGLARSGTTMLLRAIHDTGDFCSLTYRDMPFVLAPNTWARISQPGERQMSKAERAHADGVLVDYDSPEAFEEVFWRIFAGDRYIKPGSITSMRTNAELRDRFRVYVAMILRRYDASRYLSKNNNNVIRLDGIAAAFPGATILTPFRDPLQQAQSLRQQHSLFSTMHERDRFSQAYMRWLVHHEFGQDHRPFEWGLELAAGLPIDGVDYWLAQWVGVYGHLLKKLEVDAGALIPVCYELLCTETDAAWGALVDRLSLNSTTPPEFSLRSGEIFDIQRRDLLERATEIYQALVSHCRRRLMAAS